jgi:YggT family protein
MFILIDLIRDLVLIYTALILVRAVLSWTNAFGHHPLVLLVHRLTEPLLGPLRARLPDLGGLDLSPVVAIVGLQLAEHIVVRLLIGLTRL